MKYKLPDFFSFSAGERRGAIVLIIVILILSAVQLYTVFRKTPPASFSDSSFFQTLESESEDESQTAEFINYQYSAFSDTFELFTFDPNNVDAGDLRRLGISDRVIRTWLNYRLRGGRFYNPSDIGRIYGLSEKTAGRLMPYVKIESVESKKQGQRNAISESRKIERKDINSGDSVDFLAVRGIGPVLSGRIIKYRKLLGGYWQLDQLKEVYGLNDSLLPELADRFYADTLLLQKISINNAPEPMMRRHPYIGRHLAGGIVSYRKSAGTIKSVNELVTNGILSKEEYEKLRPYLGL